MTERVSDAELLTTVAKALGLNPNEMTGLSVSVEIDKRQAHHAARVDVAVHTAALAKLPAPPPVFRKAM